VENGSHVGRSRTRKQPHPYASPDARIGADAYWGYSPEEAIALTERFKPFGVWFFEEPCPQYDVAGLARLCARSLPVRIAGGERIYSPAQYLTLARAGAIHLFQPDASICGGILACLDVMAIARAPAVLLRGAQRAESARSTPQSLLRSPARPASGGRCS
jgi:L-alanine-DL-glutamate epimerase-like enolase superfamily enzyme